LYGRLGKAAMGSSNTAYACPDCTYNGGALASVKVTAKRSMQPASSNWLKNATIATHARQDATPKDVSYLYNFADKSPEYLKMTFEGLFFFERVVEKGAESVVLSLAKRTSKEVISEAEQVLKLAKKYRLNAESSTTKQLLKNFNMKASDWIAKYRKGSIKSVLGDVGDKTIGEIFDAANSQTRKMLIDGRFAK
jgi:hypothetical protein